MNTIQKTINLLLTTNKTSQEISQIVGDISYYTVSRYRIMLSRKKHTGKTVETMTESNLKEFYSLLNVERDTLKKTRRIVKLLLMTNKTNEEINKEVSLTILLVEHMRQVLLIKKCDWQKIKAMSDQDFKMLVRTKCPRFFKKVFPNVDHMQYPRPRRNLILHDIWQEYRQA